MDLNPYELCVVYTTVATQADAEQIGHVLLQQRLVACVQYEAIVSEYWWQGQIQRDNEIRLIMKTACLYYEQVQSAIEAIHPYDCPQILALPVEHAAAPYAQWLVQTLGTQP